jgi:integrase/recombinase XerD
MTSLDTASTTLISQEPPGRSFDEAQMAAASFLARYSGRTLEAYRHDLRGFFQWAARSRRRGDERDAPAHRTVPSVDGGTRAGRVHDRSSTVDGVRLLPVRAHRRPSRPTRPSTSADHRSIRPRREVWTAVELGVFLFTAEQLRPRPCSACRTARPQRAPGQRGVRDQRRGSGLRAWAPHPEDHSARATSPPPSRSFHARPAPSISPSASATKARSFGDATASASTDGPHTAGSSIGKRAGLGHVYPHMLRAAFIMAALDAGVPLRDVQIAARHADPRTTTIYDRRRQNFDRHAAYVVVAFVASG